MALFPPSFVDELKSRADIVQVIQERVPLRRAGTTWKGLCPFHGEKTPSFNVNGDKGFFKCFGCGVGGDVIKFVELYDKVAFPEAVRQLAAKVGLTVPEADEAKTDAAEQRDREALLKIHEVAAKWFQEQLATPAGATARRQLAARGLTPETIERLGMGYAPTAREALKARLLKDGFPMAVLLRSGLLVQRDEGTVLDRFRNRLMIPIHRDNGAIVAFGGRAMEDGQVPKYLNSPETPIYVKGRTLYGLNWSKTAISKAKYAVMVEGYFDVAQCFQAGIGNVIASSGTALTPAQAKLLKRFAAKVVLSFDPDAAGQGAAARSSELLVAEGFQVNVAMLPAGDDPDNFIRKAGGAAYQEKLRNSRQYLEYLLDRAAREHDFSKDDSRRDFLNNMLAIAARIPDAAARDQFADRLAHKARITEEVVRAEIRKAAVQKQTSVQSPQLPVIRAFKDVERGLIWALMKDPANGMSALAALEDDDLKGWASRDILAQARSLQGFPTESLPEALIERLTNGEAALVRQICAPDVPPVLVLDHCVAEFLRKRLVRERAEAQHEIARLQEQGLSSDERINALWLTIKGLSQRIEALMGEAPSKVSG
ncbi:MAG TPA: DNA primase [Vicinamibacterales bacterium]